MKNREIKMKAYEAHKNNSKNKDRGKLKYQGKMPAFVMCLKEMVYHEGRISTGAFNCWMVLKSFVGQRDEKGNYEAVWPGRRTLAIMMGKSMSRVSEYLAELRRMKLLKTYQAGQTYYHLLYDPPKSWQTSCEKQLEKAREEAEIEKMEKIRVVPTTTS